MASMVVARAAARPCAVSGPPHAAPQCICRLQYMASDGPSPPMRALQTVRSARPQQQAAFRAPARSMYFHTRREVVAAAAEVGGAVGAAAGGAPPPALHAPASRHARGGLTAPRPVTLPRRPRRWRRWRSWTRWTRCPPRCARAACSPLLAAALPRLPPVSRPCRLTPRLAPPPPLDQTFAEKLAKLQAAEGGAAPPADFALNFLWLDKNIAVAVDQVFGAVRAAGCGCCGFCGFCGC